MINKGMRRLETKSKITKIEKLLKSEGYSSQNPIIDIKEISKKIFNIDCIDCELLVSIRQTSLAIKRKNIVLINSTISEQDKKLEIAKQLISIFYATNNENDLNKLILAFFLPKSTYLLLKQQKLADKEILKAIKFENNQFLLDCIKQYYCTTHILEKLIMKLNKNVKYIFNKLIDNKNAKNSNYG